MSLADHFVLVRTSGNASHRSIVEIARFESLLFGLNTGVDFGPFVEKIDTAVTQLANRRWLRVMALMSWFNASSEPLREGCAWLDRPYESLGGISPFEATVDDEAFAKAYALAFLTGGSDRDLQAIEAELLSEFCSPRAVLLSSTNRCASFLSQVFWALHECAGSIVGARLMLTCAPVAGERSVTLYRLVRECDAETIDEILRTQFGYTGEGVDR